MATNILEELAQRFGPAALITQETRDEIPTAWVSAAQSVEVLDWLKGPTGGDYPMLFDLTAIDERARTHREGQPAADFSVVYHLLSFSRNQDIRIKVPLAGEHPSVRTVTGLWPNADWYEREVWDMFGVKFDGHPNLRRILMPPWWEGHPLRKEHPARGTEMGLFHMDQQDAERMMAQLAFDPDTWGFGGRKPKVADHEILFLNMGPQHPSTHGLLRLVVELDGEEIVDAAGDIGYHHRGAEKMAERQSWHTFIPYTDRIDYLGGCMNNLPYVMAVEKLAGIEVPDRAKVIRIMMAEIFRIISHLVFYGTYSQDTGQMSPVFYMFNDRERAFDIVEGITGGRMHPEWFRIGGVAQDLPEGWDDLVRSWIAWMRRRVKDYEVAVLGDRLIKARSKGIGALSLPEAIAWGATGPFLRACGLEFDFRKNRPYGGYDQFDFDIPTGRAGDSFDRLRVHAEEIKQSLRIIEQCVQKMPPGDYIARHPKATPPLKERTMRDIETLIDHFLNVSWGPVIPPGEASMTCETTKGDTAYYCVSDGGTISYRTRIRTPSFAHVQMVPFMSRGLTISDLVVIMASADFVLADIDR